jgi:hypothetical protein
VETLFGALDMMSFTRLLTLRVGMGPLVLGVSAPSADARAAVPTESSRQEMTQADGSAARTMPCQ